MEMYVEEGCGDDGRVAVMGGGLWNPIVEASGGRP